MAEDNAQRLKRKADQAWEMAGLARQDGDSADEKKWMERARELDRQWAKMVEG